MSNVKYLFDAIKIIYITKALQKYYFFIIFWITIAKSWKMLGNKI